MLSRPSQEQIHAMLGRSDLEFAPQVYSLKAGDQITGILEGHGPSTTFTQIDPIARTEVSREVDTWILRHPVSGYRLSILSSVQLDKKLPPFMPADGFECEVTIFRGEDQKTSKNFRVTDYTVAGTKRPDGKRRSWVQAKVIQVEGRESRTIDGPATAPQLADGEDAQA